MNSRTQRGQVRLQPRMLPVVCASAMFSKRHYNAVAKVMQGLRPPALFKAEGDQHYSTCIALAEMFARDNSLFNRNLFLHMCGGYK